MSNISKAKIFKTEFGNSVKGYESTWNHGVVYFVDVNTENSNSFSVYAGKLDAGVIKESYEISDDLFYNQEEAFDYAHGKAMNKDYYHIGGGIQFESDDNDDESEINIKSAILVKGHPEVTVGIDNSDNVVVFFSKNYEKGVNKGDYKVLSNDKEAFYLLGYANPLSHEEKEDYDKYIHEVKEFIKNESDEIDDEDEFKRGGEAGKKDKYKEYLRILFKDYSLGVEKVDNETYRIKIIPTTDIDELTEIIDEMEDLRLENLKGVDYKSPYIFRYHETKKEDSNQYVYVKLDEVYADGGGVEEFPQKGELTNKNNFILKYEKKGGEYEFFVYVPAIKELSESNQIKYICINKDSPQKMPYKQFINYLYAELYLDDTQYADGGGVDGVRYFYVKGRNEDAPKSLQDTYSHFDSEKELTDYLKKWKDVPNVSFSNVTKVYSDGKSEDVSGFYLEDSFANGGGVGIINEKDFITKKQFKKGNTLIKLEKLSNPTYYRVNYIDLIDNEVSSYGSPYFEDVIFDINQTKYSDGGGVEVSKSGSLEDNDHITYEISVHEINPHFNHKLIGTIEKYDDNEYWATYGNELYDDVEEEEETFSNFSDAEKWVLGKLNDEKEYYIENYSEYSNGGGVELPIYKNGWINGDKFEVIGYNKKQGIVRVKDFTKHGFKEMTFEEWYPYTFELGTPARFTKNNKQYIGEVVMRNGEKSISLYKDENYAGNEERVVPFSKIDLATLRPSSMKEVFKYGGKVGEMFYIHEGYDHKNSKPIFRVESTSDSEYEYIGDWHEDENDAKDELKALNSTTKRVNSKEHLISILKDAISTYIQEKYNENVDWDNSFLKSTYKDGEFKFDNSDVSTFEGNDYHVTPNDLVNKSYAGGGSIKLDASNKKTKGSIFKATNFQNGLFIWINKLNSTYKEEYKYGVYNASDKEKIVLFKTLEDAENFYEQSISRLERTSRISKSYSNEALRDGREVWLNAAGREETIGREPMFLKYNGDEIMKDRVFDEYYVGENVFSTLEEAKEYIDEN